MKELQVFYMCLGAIGFVGNTFFFFVNGPSAIGAGGAILGLIVFLGGYFSHQALTRSDLQ